MTRDEIFTKLMELAILINNNKKKSLYEKRQIVVLNTELKKTKLKYELDVANEVDAAGKPKYSNADKRSVEVANRLETDKVYCEKEKLRDAKQEAIEDIEIEVSNDVYMFRAYEAFANFKE